MDPARDDDEAGTDGDDEAEIVDNQIKVRNNKKSGTGSSTSVSGNSGVASKVASGGTASATTSGGSSRVGSSGDLTENWVEVKSKKSDRKSLPKENFDSKKDDQREDLEFQFDEDLDIPIGRQNKFSSM